MATYDKVIDYTTSTVSLKLKERSIYGSSRLGVRSSDVDMLTVTSHNFSMKSVKYEIGKRTYELSNHLGNVLSVISDKVTPSFEAGNLAGMLADVRVAQDYSPFGVVLSGRNFEVDGGYRYGFNSMEADNEVKGRGNSYTTEFRQYDSRIGRWLSIDPLFKNFPWQSPYVAFDNNPILFNDPFGEAADNTNEKNEPAPGESSSVNSGEAQKSQDQKLSTSQVNGLFNTDEKPEVQFKAIVSIQKGSYKMNSSEMLDAINDSKAPDFLKKNLKQLKNIDEISINDGILSIKLKKGVSSINLESNENTLKIENGASIDYSNLKIFTKEYTGTQSKENTAEWKEKGYIVNGAIKFNGVSASIGYGVYTSLLKSEYSTTIRSIVNDYNRTVHQLNYKVKQVTGVKNVKFEVQMRIPYNLINF